MYCEAGIVVVFSLICLTFCEKTFTLCLVFLSSILPDTFALSFFKRKANVPNYFSKLSKTDTCWKQESSRKEIFSCIIDEFYLLFLILGKVVLFVLMYSFFNFLRSFIIGMFSYQQVYISCNVFYLVISSLQLSLSYHLGHTFCLFLYFSFSPVFIKKCQ